MRAATYRRYGAPQVVTIEDRDRPVPALGEVLIRVAAASVGAADSAARLGEPRAARLFFGLPRPRVAVLGSDFAGVVESVGDGVTRFAAGDRVFGASGATLGCHAEYLARPADGAIAALPAEVSFEQAVALTDGALTALPFLRDTARIQSGHRVLVNGASGAVGSAAVQLAVHFGARVTAVTSSGNLELARDLGAHDTIDYTTTDFTESGRTFDIVFDAVGKSSFWRARRVLSPHGIYLSTVPGVILLQALFTKRAAISFTGLRKDADKRPDLVELARLARAGALRPLVDGIHPLDDMVAAHARVDSGRKRGTVVVRPTQP